MSCTAATIGTPPRDALFCKGPPSQILRGGESVFSLRIFTTQGKAAQLSLDVPIAAGPLDREGEPSPSDPNEGQYIALDAVLDASGAVLTVREKTGASCVTALAQYKDPELAPHRRVITAACAAKGTYRWTNDGGGRFVKVP